MSKGHVTLVKGEAILSELGWIKYKKGQQGLVRVFENLNQGSPNSLSIQESNFEPGGWYPVETQHDILTAIYELYGDGDPNIIKEVGAHGVKKIGQFRFVLRFMQVKKVAEKMADNLMVLYRTTDMTIKDTGEKSMDISVIGFPNDILYIKLLEGGIEQLFTYLSIRDLKLESDMSVLDDDLSSCNFKMSWI